MTPNPTPVPGATDGEPGGGTTRRRFLYVSGAGALGVGAIVLTGCGSSDSTTSAASSAPASPESSSPSDSPSASGSASAKPTEAAAPNAIAKVADVPQGGSAAAKLDGKPIILHRTGDTVAAFSAICPHQGCTVNPGKEKLTCPCHGSVFNAKTGAVINGPAQTGLSKVSVQVTGSSIVKG